jgi:hypothetical protein
MKKTTYILIIGFFVAPFLALADASSSISLPSDFNANIWAQAQALFTGFAGYIELIVGVILAAIVLEIVIGALRPH